MSRLTAVIQDAGGVGIDTAAAIEAALKKQHACFNGCNQCAREHLATIAVERAREVLKPLRNADVLQIGESFLWGPTFSVKAKKDAGTALIDIRYERAVNSHGLVHNQTGSASLEFSPEGFWKVAGRYEYPCEPVPLVEAKTGSVVDIAEQYWAVCTRCSTQAPFTWPSVKNPRCTMVKDGVLSTRCKACGEVPLSEWMLFRMPSSITVPEFPTVAISAGDM